ncbi:MAG TPA: DUF4922 domain-containing protein [Ignavibacteriaceae bacterium]|nr:DUF4922 domain-containing protein [Ignavibacteriaceae bacterium]
MLKTKNDASEDNSKSKLQDLINQNKFSDAISFLFNKQQKDWPLLQQGLEALSEVRSKKFIFDGYEIRTQYNPGRINSTTANVSTESIKNRKCFLCAENLPEKQEGILYNDYYSILLNPYPIFPQHLTISSLDHKPQRIKNTFNDMIQLSKDLTDFIIVYNGPESGASAPDHFHFQACKKDRMPVYNDYNNLKKKYGEEIRNNDVKVYGIDDGIRRIISIESPSSNDLIKTFRNIYDLYSIISKSHVEPMMNILTFYDETEWKVIIFFRKKHRPDAYFRENEYNILVSPASVDLGGVLITPLEKDFNKIDKETITQIFREVLIGKEEFEYLKTKLK